MRVVDLFERGVSMFPDRACLVEGKTSRSYAEVKARVEALAGALHDLAGAVDERCSIIAPNSAIAIECMLAIYRAGKVSVPLSAKSGVAENAHVARQGEVTTLLFHSSLRLHVEELKKECPGICRFICMDAPQLGAEDAEALMRLGKPAPPRLTPDNRRLVGIYSTGGTTGMPKGVMFNSLMWETMAANLFAVMPCAEGEIVYLMITPFTHAAGTTGQVLFGKGATIVIQNGFNAEAVIDAIEKEKVTHLFLPPTAIYMLLAHPGVEKRDFSSLKTFLYAASPMSVQKLRECIKVFGPVMFQSWGQTEAPMFCTCLTEKEHVEALDGHEHRLASCGRAGVFTPVAVMADDGSLLPDGERGELVVGGNLVTSGYYKNAEATASATRNGWHRTGDVGYRDKDGFFYIVDRLKDMIITGGFNVFPGEVEQVIWSHAAVKECAVVGVPDEKWGEAVKAVIEIKPGASVTEAEIMALCKERLGSVKTPKSVEFWDELPRTPVGKVSKKEIRARFWKGHARAI